MSDDRLSLMLEAERRGILPQDDQALLSEARRRGLIESPAQPKPARDPSEYDPKSSEYQAKYGAGAPSRIARIGRGAQDVNQGLVQRLLQGISAVPQATPSVQELRAYASPDEQKLGDDELRAKFQAQDPAANYTQGVNDEIALYEQGRGPDAGTDWARIAGTVAATAPLAALAPAGGTTTLGRAGAGAIGGGVSGAAGFTPSGEIKDTLASTALGTAAGAVAAPIVGKAGDFGSKLVQKMLGYFRGLKAGTASADDLVTQVPELGTLPAEAQRDLISEAQAQLAKTGTLDAQAIARKANLIAQGVKPTKAMVTRDPGDWTMERNLQKLSQSPDDSLSSVGRELTDLYQGNDRALTQSLAKVGEGLPQKTQEAHGMAVMKSLDELADASQEKVGELYSAVRAAKGDQLASDARNLASTLDDLKDNTYAEKLVSSVSNKLKRFGMLDAQGNPTTNTLTVNQAEELRKFVNKLPNDFGKKDIIKAIDADVFSGMGEDAFGGARAAAASRFQMLDNPSTQRALNTLGELSQGKTAQNFIKSQVIDAADQDVATLVQTLGKLPPDKATEAMNSLRAGIVQHLQEKAIKPDGKFSGAALNKAMRDIGESKLIRILGVDQHKQLQNIARAGIDATYEPAYSAVNHSGTAPMLLSLTQRARAIPGVPLLLSEEAQKLAAQTGYRSQLARVLDARASGKLPELPASAAQLAQALRASSGPTSAAILNELREPMNQKSSKRKK